MTLTIPEIKGVLLDLVERGSDGDIIKLTKWQVVALEQAAELLKAGDLPELKN